jgi:hypothetical protein
MKRSSVVGIAGLIASLLICGGQAIAEDWGNLTGRFIYDGKAPTPETLSITKDQAYCGKAPTLVDEELVVGKDGGLANVVVWVRTKGVKIHPDYEKAATTKVAIDNKHCRFDPHIVVYRTGGPLEIKNSDTDDVAHNTNCSLIANDPFNIQLPVGTAQDVNPLANTETVPAKISCNIHPWMKGWLVVQPTPYVAVSDESGKFEIKNLPAGTELEFQVWQEKSGNVDKAQIGGKDAGWTRGRFKHTIKAGNNDLGEIKLDPKQFNK